VEYVNRHRGRLAKVAAQAARDAHERAANLITELDDARDQLASAREQQLWVSAYGHHDEALEQMMAWSA
jgi:hypothetical protein